VNEPNTMGESTTKRMRRNVRNVCERFVDLWRDEDASVIAEYALVFTFFTIVSVVALTAVSQTANNEVDINESNFSNSMVVGN
jgi:Flp pilus assembly pilin Flp